MSTDTDEITADDGHFPLLRDRGRPKKGSAKSSVTTFIGRGRDYNLARLDRDRPDLASRVRAGIITANAGAVAAGFRRRARRRKRPSKLGIAETMIG